MTRLRDVQEGSSGSILERTVRVSSPKRTDQHWGLLTLWRVNRKGTEAAHSHSSGAKVQEKVEYTSTETCAFMGRNCRCAVAMCQGSCTATTGSRFAGKRCRSQQRHSRRPFAKIINPLNAELNPICYLLALLAQNFFPR